MSAKCGAPIVRPTSRSKPNPNRPPHNLSCRGHGSYPDGRCWCHSDHPDAIAKRLNRWPDDEASDLLEWLGRPAPTAPTPDESISSALFAATAVYLGMLNRSQCIAINDAIAAARADALR